MTISAQVRRGPGDWYGSPVKVFVQQHANRYVLRIQLYSKIALELRLSHARRLVDLINDVLDAHEAEHPHEEAEHGESPEA